MCGRGGGGEVQVGARRVRGVRAAVAEHGNHKAGYVSDASAANCKICTRTRTR